MICVSLAETSQESTQSLLKEYSPYAECAEIRIDALKDIKEFDFNQIINSVPIPLIFTNRMKPEGGYFDGPETERLLYLIKAIQAGAAYVDIELRSKREDVDYLIHEGNRLKTKIIVSYHDFSATPSEDKLIEVFEQIKQTGGDVAKIVTWAREPDDILRVLSLYKKEVRGSFPLAAFCMGEMGKISRLVSMALGSCLVYTSAVKGKNTAPGQISIKDFQTIITLIQN